MNSQFLFLTFETNLPLALKVLEKAEWKRNECSKENLTFTVIAIMVPILCPAEPPLLQKTFIRSSVYLSSCPINFDVRGTFVICMNSKLFLKEKRTYLTYTYNYINCILQILSHHTYLINIKQCWPSVPDLCYHYIFLKNKWIQPFFIA